MQQPEQKKNSDVKGSHCDATWDDSVQRMEVGDNNYSGIAIGWADDATLHACLGVAGPPIPQGGNAVASGVALQAWFSGLVVAVNANSPVILAGGIPSSEFFDHLSIVEYGAFTQVLFAPPIMAWGSPLHAAGLSAGRFYMVTDAGRGRNHALQRTFVPFL